MRKLPIFIVALIVATGAFWVTMLTTPPKTVAAPSVPFSIYDMTIEKNLPTAEFADAS
jgi:hypothetical protein